MGIEIERRFLSMGVTTSLGVQEIIVKCPALSFRCEPHRWKNCGSINNRGREVLENSDDLENSFE